MKPTKQQNQASKKGRDCATNEIGAIESAANASAANASAANESAANESAANDLFIWIGGPSVSASFSSNLPDTRFRDGSCIMPMAVEVLNTW